MTSWSTLSGWYEAVGPEGAAIAMVRAVALVLASWLLVSAVLQALAALPALSPLRPLADLISPRSMQRLGRSLAGLSLTAGLAAPAPGAGTLAPDQEAPPVAITTSIDEPATATMRVIEPPPDAEPQPPNPEEAAGPMTVTVARGDSFWSIAIDHLSEVVGGPLSDGDVAPYWRRLVEANRSQLVVPDNPDLLYAGQLLELPPVV